MLVSAILRGGLVDVTSIVMSKAICHLVPPEDACSMLAQASGSTLKPFFRCPVDTIVGTRVQQRS